MEGSLGRHEPVDTIRHIIGPTLRKSRRGHHSLFNTEPFKYWGTAEKKAYLFPSFLPDLWKLKKRPAFRSYPKWELQFPQQDPKIPPSLIYKSIKSRLICGRGFPYSYGTPCFQPVAPPNWGTPWGHYVYLILIFFLEERMEPIGYSHKPNWIHSQKDWTTFRSWDPVQSGCHPNT